MGEGYTSETPATSSTREYSTDEHEADQKNRPKSDTIAFLLSNSDSARAKVQHSAVQKEAETEGIAQQIVLTSPSTLEIMTFL